MHTSKSISEITSRVDNKMFKDGLKSFNITANNFEMAASHVLDQMFHTSNSNQLFINQTITGYEVNYNDSTITIDTGEYKEIMDLRLSKYSDEMEFIQEFQQTLKSKIIKFGLKLTPIDLKKYNLSLNYFGITELILIKLFDSKFAQNHEILMSKNWKMESGYIVITFDSYFKDFKASYDIHLSFNELDAIMKPLLIQTIYESLSDIKFPTITQKTHKYPSKLELPLTTLVESDEVSKFSHVNMENEVEKFVDKLMYSKDSESVNIDIARWGIVLSMDESKERRMITSMKHIAINSSRRIEIPVYLLDQWNESIRLYETNGAVTANDKYSIPEFIYHQLKKHATYDHGLRISQNGEIKFYQEGFGINITAEDLKTSQEVKFDLYIEYINFGLEVPELRP